MRYYLDFEFCDASLTPISMGLVAQNGRELYLVNVHYRNVIAASPNREWLEANVLPNIYGNADEVRSTKTYNLDWWSNEINDFLADGAASGTPELWGYFADYDWVLFCRLFGTMMDLPKYLPHYCLDLKQLGLSLGYTESLKKLVPLEGEHNALADARWAKNVHEQMIFQHGRAM